MTVNFWGVLFLISVFTFQGIANSRQARTKIDAIINDAQASDSFADLVNEINLSLRNDGLEFTSDFKSNIRALLEKGLITNEEAILGEKNSDQLSSTSFNAAVTNSFVYFTLVSKERYASAQIILPIVGLTLFFAAIYAITKQNQNLQGEICPSGTYYFQNQCIPDYIQIPSDKTINDFF